MCNGYGCCINVSHLCIWIFIFRLDWSYNEELQLGAHFRFYCEISVVKISHMDKNIHKMSQHVGKKHIYGVHKVFGYFMHLSTSFWNVSGLTFQNFFPYHSNLVLEAANRYNVFMWSYGRTILIPPSGNYPCNLKTATASSDRSKICQSLSSWIKKPNNLEVTWLVH